LLLGKFRAQVINNKDPEMRGRLLVKSPRVLNNHELGWAESCLPPGYFTLPRKLDWVWIEFEEGDVNKPIWVGIMPTRAYTRDYLLRTSSYPLTTMALSNPLGNVEVIGKKLYGNLDWTSNK
jgi:Type VI secretion system/phage-baseplate injector OB domain